MQARTILNRSQVKTVPITLPALNGVVPTGLVIDQATIPEGLTVNIVSSTTTEVLIRFKASNTMKYGYYNLTLTGNSSTYKLKIPMLVSDKTDIYSGYPTTPTYTNQSYIDISKSPNPKFRIAFKNAEYDFSNNKINIVSPGSLELVSCIDVYNHSGQPFAFREKTGPYGPFGLTQEATPRTFFFNGHYTLYVESGIYTPVVYSNNPETNLVYNSNVIKEVILLISDVFCSIKNVTVTGPTPQIFSGTWVKKPNYLVSI